jgi:hypothetical protein
LDRSLVEDNSPSTTGPTAPHEAPYEKMKRLTNAERHLAAAVLPGAATPTMANVSMEMPWAAAPVMRMARRPKNLISGKAAADPAIPQMPVITEMTNGLVTPDKLRKYVP